MGNTRDTGYLRNLVVYDGSGNIVLPANLTVTGSIVGYATTSYVTIQINNLINGAPGLLDTLDELAAALGDDANFASTITTSLAGKQSTLTFTGPLVNTSGTITITQSSGSTNGFLSNTDWTTFNSKQSTLTFSGPLVNTSGTISITQSSGSTNGYLSNTDWTTFNNKQAALSGTGFVKISGTTISYDNSTYLTTASATSTYLPLAGGTLTGALLFNSTAPLNFQANSNNGTYNPTVIYFNQNNTSANTANGIFIERGRLTDSSSAEVRYFVIGARGGTIQWQVDGSGNTTQTGSITNAGEYYASVNNTYLRGRNSGNTAYIATIGVNGSNKVAIDPDGYGAVFGAGVTATSFGGGVYPYNSILGSGADASTGTIFAGSTAGYASSIDVAGGGATNPNTIIFKTASTERFRIASTGAATLTGPGLHIDRPSNSSGEPYIFFNKNGVTRGSIYGADGTAGLRFFSDVNTFYGTISATAGTFSSNFATLSVIGTNATSPHIGSTWTVNSNQDGLGRTIISTAGQGRAMYFENNGNILIPNTSLSVGGKIYSTSIHGSNLVVGNIASNMPSSPAYILIVDLNNIAGFSLSGKVNAASYTCWNISDIYIQKNYSSTTATAGIEGKYKSGCDFSIVNITYGGGNYIALRFTSNPEIDVLWTGFRLVDLLSGGAFQVITSGVTVNSTYATY
jgi:hypothetical protein